MSTNLIKNKKNCDAYLSTQSSCLDYFTLSSKVIPSTLSSFKTIVNTIISSKNEVPEMFLRILKFHRLIENGNGIRWIYYLSMIILKMEDVSTYQSILNWSWEYAKDFHNLHRLQYYMDKKKKITLELKLYGDLLFSMFLDLLRNSFDQRYNPMLVKYLSFEKGHWYKETSFIWEYLETLFQSHSTMINYIEGKTELRDELSRELRNILFHRIKQTNYKKNDPYFSNKVRRQIKVLFDHHINLTDNLFKGIHNDGSLFGSHGLEKEKEINMIYDVIRKTPSISNQLFSKKIKLIQQKHLVSNKDVLDSYEEKIKVRLLRDDLLVCGYLKYIDSIKSKKIVAKVRGVDLNKECYDYYLSVEKDKYDYNLESKLNEMIKKSSDYLMCCFNESFTFDDFSKSIVLLLDISSSMDREPVSIGLLYILVMVKLFRVKKVYTFACSAKCITICDDDIDGRILDLIDKLYVRTGGFTNLQSAFKLFEKEKIQNKKIMIITDGDCDEDCGKSPFQTIMEKGSKCKFLSSNSYLIANVSEDQLSFPYLSRDKNVCYVGGINTKCIQGLIKAFIISIEEKIPINPLLVLQYSIDIKELELPIVSMNLPYSKGLTNDEIENLYNAFHQNQPPKRVTTSEYSTNCVNQIEDDDKSYQDDGDENDVY